MDLKLSLVQLCSKILTKMDRGGSLPGHLGLIMDKEFIQRFNMPNIVILVTGTNGKTSTSNMITECLRANGLSVINNRRGDNLNYGIATLLASNADSNYNIKANAAVIEIDELTLYRQFNNLKPTHLVLTNFFRDQLDRAGEMETIIRKIEEVVKDFKGDLVLNGDDPNIVRIGEANQNGKVHYYSVGEYDKSKKETDEASEGKFCPLCNKPLKYEYYQYSHIGRFKCENDNFGDIEKDVFVEKINDDYSFMVEGYEYHPRLKAIFNIYNCAAVINTVKTLNLNYKDVADNIFSNFEVKEGRNELFHLNKDCRLNLIKNPTGANEVMKYVLSDDKDKNVCIILNDNIPDGTDISWIWDAHFERLNVDSVKHIICSGLRAYDIALRLKYEGLKDKIIVIEDFKEVINYLNNDNLESHILSTYTALLKMRSLLEKESL